MRQYNKIFILVGLVLLTSCEGMLNEVPRNSIDPGNFFNNDEECFAAIAGCYKYTGNKGYMDANWWGAFQAPAIMTDEVNWQSSNNSGYRAISFCQFTDREQVIYNIWSGSYAAINWVNTCIKGFDESTGITDEQKSKYIGEAKFIRALFYFNLVRFFGDVPLYSTPVLTMEEVKVPRSPSDSVYALIINDLKAAKGLPEVMDNGRATKGAATALLAKVYAQMAGYPLKQADKWEDCRRECEELISNTKYSLYGSYFNIFHVEHENNSEVLFDVQFAEGDILGSNLGAYFSGVGGVLGYGGRGGGSTAFIMKEHNAKYETISGIRDLRYDRNIGNKTINSNTGLLTTNIPNMSQYTIKKFAKLKDAGTGYVNSWTMAGNPTNVIVLRLADIYLLYAEVLNELEAGAAPPAAALEYVNKVRRRAWNLPFGTPNADVDWSLANTATKDDFRNKIMDERSRELCFEGHRWFDLVRWQKLLEKVKECDCPAKDNIGQKNYLYPIPYNERLLNPKLTQNSGWPGGETIIEN